MVYQGTHSCIYLCVCVFVCFFYLCLEFTVFRCSQAFSLHIKKFPHFTASQVTFISSFLSHLSVPSLLIVQLITMNTSVNEQGAEQAVMLKEWSSWLTEGYASINSWPKLQIILAGKNLVQKHSWILFSKELGSWASLGSHFKDCEVTLFSAEVGCKAGMFSNFFL